MALFFRKKQDPHDPLKILFISAEVDPFSKAGGLGDVARSLPKALRRRQHEIAVVTPRYGSIDPAEFDLISAGAYTTTISHVPVKFEVKKGWLMEGLPVYFIDQPKYFSRRQKVYGYPDDNIRFRVFNNAAVTLLENLDWKPDVIHCNDWHTGLIPAMLHPKISLKIPFTRRPATVLTLHNPHFHGQRPWKKIPARSRDNGRSPLPPLESKLNANVDLLLRGLNKTDVANTVSRRYLEEIQTPEYGEGLSGTFQRLHTEGRLFGIRNGIDYNDWNPATDHHLARQFDFNSIERKGVNKLYWQRSTSLTVDPNIPMIGLTNRITEQKGFDLIVSIAEALMELPLQLVVIGEGEAHYVDFLKRLARRYPKKVVFYSFSPERESQVMAAADMFLMPSRFEPMGLGQLKALRYGAIPIVHATGGLYDSVQDYDPIARAGNGFSFTRYEGWSLFAAIIRALETFRRPDEWHAMQRHAMQQSFSWDIPATQYEQLYRHAIAIHAKESILGEVSTEA